MTVENVIARLQRFPPKMEVWIHELNSEFPNAPMEAIEVREISMMEEPDSNKVLNKEMVVVLSDEI